MRLFNAYIFRLRHAIDRARIDARPVAP